MSNLTHKEKAILSEYESKTVPVLKGIVAAFKAKEKELTDKNTFTVKIGAPYSDDRFYAAGSVEALTRSNRKFIEEFLADPKNEGYIPRIQGNAVDYCSYFTWNMEEQCEHSTTTLAESLETVRSFTGKSTNTGYMGKDNKEVHMFGIQTILNDIAKNGGDDLTKLSEVDRNFVQAVAAYDDFYETWIKGDKNKYGKVAAAAQRFAEESVKDRTDKKTAAEVQEADTTSNHVKNLLQQARKRSGSNLPNH